MTHGEQWVHNKEKFYKNGNQFEECDSIDKGLPKRMAPKEASSYYNQKLLDYWVDNFDQDIRPDKRTQIIKFLMFKDPNYSIST